MGKITLKKEEKKLSDREKELKLREFNKSPESVVPYIKAEEGSLVNGNFKL